MGRLTDKWNKKRFSIYDSEEKTVLKIFETMKNFINDEVVPTIDEKTDITDYNNLKSVVDKKTDNTGDHKGSWQGLKKPTLSEEGMRATVEKLDKDITKITGDITNISNVNNFPQGTKPPKINPSGNCFKIGYKADENTLKIIQPTNKGYVCYSLAQNSGASKETDYGINHELLRLVKAEFSPVTYLYYDLSTPVTGTWAGYLYEESVRNTTEDIMHFTTNVVDGGTISSKADKKGLGAFKLLYGNNVTFNIPISLQQEFTLAYMGSANGSIGTIYVNDVKVATFNSKSTITGSNNGIGYVKFLVPTKSTGDTTFTIKIANEDTTGYCYPIALNVVELKDYNNQMINNFKMFGGGKTWIGTSGASDYAIYDYTNKKWFGSYHGGEKIKIQQINWVEKTVLENNFLKRRKTFADIVVNDWVVTDDVDIYQVTDLANGGATMVSKWGFNEKGTMDMNCSYYDGTIDVSTFYTALTCTDFSFNNIFFPIYRPLGNTPSNEDILIPLTEGYVSQVDGENVMQLDIRFTKFNNVLNQEQCKIADVINYRKLYYGLVYGGSNHRVVEKVNFSKSLDFIVR